METAAAKGKEPSTLLGNGNIYSSVQHKRGLPWWRDICNMHQHYIPQHKRQILSRVSRRKDEKEDVLVRE